MVTLIKAATGRITTHHGRDIGRGFDHVGIDIGNGMMGTADLRMVAPAAGKITAAGWLGTYGNRVIITHADGSWSLLAHLESIAVKVGASVKQGQQIGVMGRTGGPWGTAGWYVHGHQEYHINGQPVDPLDYMLTTAGGNLTPTEGDEMPKTFENKYTGPAIDVPDGKVFMLPKTTRTATYNLARAPKSGEVGSVTGYFRLTGLPKGEQVQVRLAMYKGSKVVRTMPWAEPTPGSEGGTLIQFHTNYTLKDAEELRFQMLVFTKGAKNVKLTNIESYGQYWS